jgi:hypothetical protein
MAASAEILGLVRRWAAAGQDNDAERLEGLLAGGLHHQPGATDRPGCPLGGAPGDHAGGRVPGGALLRPLAGQVGVLGVGLEAFPEGLELRHDPPQLLQVQGGQAGEPVPALGGEVQPHRP